MKQICPGCGWFGPECAVEKYGGGTRCPVCEYEAPYGGLMSLVEMEATVREFHNVRMDKFLPAISAARWTMMADEEPPVDVFVLVFAYGQVVIGRKTEDGNWWANNIPTDSEDITHWRHLPSPPPIVRGAGR